MKLIRLLIVSILAGCASGPPVEVPEWNETPPDPTTPAEPLPLPTLCAIPWDTQDVACWAALDAYDVAAQANAGIAEKNRAGLLKTQAAARHYFLAGQSQADFSAIREDQLAECRQAHKWDNWTHRGIIAAGLLIWGASQ